MRRCGTDKFKSWKEEYALDRTELEKLAAISVYLAVNAESSEAERRTSQWKVWLATMGFFISA